ncbi:MAG: PIN domain nuclease [Desulfitobacteriaceae bacterium]
MKKLKIYLDTSVISHLQADDVPEKMAITLKFWDDVKAGQFDVYISEVTEAEIADCPEPKKTVLGEHLKEVSVHTIELTEEITDLAQRYLILGVLPPKCVDDSIHVAAATFAGCNAIVSWNFKHILKLRAFIGVNGVNRMLGYGEIALIPPYELLEEDD